MKVSAGGPFTGSQAQIILLLLVIYRKARNMVADPDPWGSALILFATLIFMKVN